MTVHPQQYCATLNLGLSRGFRTLIWLALFLPSLAESGSGIYEKFPGVNKVGFKCQLDATEKAKEIDLVRRACQIAHDSFQQKMGNKIHKGKFEIIDISGKEKIEKDEVVIWFQFKAMALDEIKGNHKTGNTIIILTIFRSYKSSKGEVAYGPLQPSAALQLVIIDSSKPNNQQAILKLRGVSRTLSALLVRGRPMP